jgi:hypothetical protein
VVTRLREGYGGLQIKSRSKRKKLQDLVPFALVFEHDLAKKANGRHAVIEQLVMEFLQ